MQLVLFYKSDTKRKEVVDGSNERLLHQGFHLAFFQKLKRKNAKTQAHFWKNSSHFFSKTQQNLQNSTFRKILTKFEHFQTNFKC